jgi:uncharacterized membrane protein
MSAPLVVLALWGAFAASHMALSSLRLRPRLVSVLGERGFLGLYSAAALVLFTALVWFYIDHRHAGALLWAPVAGPAARAAIYALEGATWIAIVAGFATPNPVALGVPEGRWPREPRGIHRITRHPALMGFGMVGLLHLPVTGFASDVAFWAGFPLFAVIGCWHQDRRKLATLGEPYRAFHAATPFLPFTRRGALRGVAELPPLAIALGLGLAVGLRWLHGPLFH